MQKEGKEVEIHFGDVYETFAGKDRTSYVIIDVGEGDIFYSSNISKSSDNQDLLMFPGTHDLNHVERVRGRWSLEQIVLARRLVFELSNINFSEESIRENLDALVKCSKIPSRIIVW